MGVQLLTGKSQPEFFPGWAVPKAQFPHKLLRNTSGGGNFPAVDAHGVQHGAQVTYKLPLFLVVLHRFSDRKHDQLIAPGLNKAGEDKHHFIHAEQLSQGSALHIRHGGRHGRDRRFWFSRQDHIVGKFFAECSLQKIIRRDPWPDLVKGLGKNAAFEFVLR